MYAQVLTKSSNSVFYRSCGSCTEMPCLVVQDLPKVFHGSRSNSSKNYKTELCKNYIEGKVNCPYGDRCNYAHGENELRGFKSPTEMKDEGVIDNAETYCRLPCFDHMATGSCPMGNRCNSLHDPHVAGSNASWLNQFTKPKRKSLCAIPDPLLYHRDLSMFQQNPIVDHRVWSLFGDEKNDFEVSYKLVCNIEVPVFHPRFVLPQPSTKLHEVYKLCIVRKMQAEKGPASHNFTYQNKQSLNGQPCLVLQTRYFRLLSIKPVAPNKIDDLVQEISVSEYDRNHLMMIRADEIVFESKGKYNCNHSIWFDADISSSHGSAKHHDIGCLQSFHDKALFCMPKNGIFQLSLPPITPHVLMQPKDDSKEGHRLIDDVLKHRICDLLTSHKIICNNGIDIEAIRADFARLRNANKTWMWPPLNDEEVRKIFQGTREEHTNHAYVPRTGEAGDILPSIWSAFCSSVIDNGEQNESKPRLDVFCSITSKRVKHSYSKGAKLPHITNSTTELVSAHSEQTWKELLWGIDGPWHRAKQQYTATARGSNKIRSTSW